MSLVGTATTTFTPYPFCTKDVWNWAGYGYLLGAPTPTAACLPPGYTPGLSAYYSGSICPVGYTQACSSVTTSQTQAWCCPSSFTCNPFQSDNSLYKTVYSTRQCGSAWASTITGIIFQGATQSGIETSSAVTWTPYPGIGDLLAFGVQIRFGPTASSRSSSSARLSSITPTGSASPPPPDPEREGGLSAGAKGGIAVGVIAGVALIAALIFLLFRRRRQKRKIIGEKAEVGDGPGQDARAHNAPEVANIDAKPTEPVKPRGDQLSEIVPLFTFDPNAPHNNPTAATQSATYAEQTTTYPNPTASPTRDYEHTQLLGPTQAHSYTTYPEVVHEMSSAPHSPESQSATAVPATPSDRHVRGLSAVSDTTHLSALELERRRLDAEIAEGERLQALRDKRAAIDAQIAEANRRELP